ncbi:MAG: AAA family ATPase [Candidatus Paceibacterota bacterium]
MGVWTKDVKEIFKFLDRDKSKKRRNPNRKRVARTGCKTPIANYDRFKFIFGLLGLYLFFSVSNISRNPLVSVEEGFALAAQENSWIFALLVFELLRQMHNFAGEISRVYWTTWLSITKGVRKPFMRLRTDTRYRLARVGNILLALTLIGLVLGRVTGVGNPITGWFRSLSLFWQNIPVFLQAMAYILFAVLQFAAIFWFMSKGGVEVVMPDDVKTNFTMVWGQDQVVEKVKETLKLLEDPDLIEEKGGYVPGGILLWGPPGTGKTLIAEAMAGETGKPFVMVEPGAFQAMFFGVNILKVKGLYRKLRKLALRYGGVVVFFDEADVLGRRALAGVAPRGVRSSNESCRRGSYLNDYDSAGVYVENLAPMPVKNSVVMPTAGGDLGTLNAILASMQGLSKPRGLANRIRRLLGIRPSPAPKYRILHVMATNAPDALDPALLRPGRIDRIFRVGYPSKEGRIRTLEGYLSKVKHSLSNEDVVRIATSSPYSSGAVIKDVVNEALMAALRDDRDVIEWKDIVSAKSLKEHGATDGFEYVDRERHAVAIHEACHAVAAYRLKSDFAIDVATIERRGDVGGFVSRVPVVERMFQWKSEIEEDIQIAIASLVGERMFFSGDNTNGVSGDLDTATRLALVMETRWGMGSTIASHDVLVQGSAGNALERNDKEGKEKNISAIVGVRVESRLAELYDKTVKLLDSNRHEVLSLAHALEVFRTLNGADVEAVIGGVKGPSVDGSVYSTLSAKNALEGYHYMCLESHNLGTPSVALPDLNDLLDNKWSKEWVVKGVNSGKKVPAVKIKSDRKGAWPKKNLKSSKRSKS